LGKEINRENKNGLIKHNVLKLDPPKMRQLVSTSKGDDIFESAFDHEP